MPDEPAPPSDAIIDARIARVLAVRGATLDEVQIARLRENAERLAKAAGALDGYHLENSDEPDASFSAVDRVDRA